MVQMMVIKTMKGIMILATQKHDDIDDHRGGDFEDGNDSHGNGTHPEETEVYPEEEQYPDETHKHPEETQAYAKHDFTPQDYEYEEK